MLIADGCAAVAIAAQAALVDQRSRKSTRRALEGAAGAGLIQRLLFHTLGHQFIHFCTDVRCVSGLQMELCREDAAAVLFKNAVAIAEIQLCGRHFSDLAFCRQIPHCGEHVLHLAAVGTRIHIHCTAHRAGDAVGKFQPGQAMLQCRLTQCRKADTCACGQDCIFHRDLCVQCRNIDHHAGKAFVRKQDVAAVAQQVIADSLLFAKRNCTAELLLVFRHDKQLCRASDFKGTVRRKRFILPERDRRCLQFLLESFHDNLLLLRCGINPFYRPDPDGSAVHALRCNPSSSGGC